MIFARKRIISTIQKIYENKYFFIIYIIIYRHILLHGNELHKNYHFIFFYANVERTKVHLYPKSSSLHSANSPSCHHYMPKISGCSNEFLLQSKKNFKKLLKPFIFRQTDKFIICEGVNVFGSACMGQRLIQTESPAQLESFAILDHF